MARPRIYKVLRFFKVYITKHLKIYITKNPGRRLRTQLIYLMPKDRRLKTNFIIRGHFFNGIDLI